MKIQKVVGGVLITVLSLTNIGFGFAASSVVTVEERPAAYTETINLPQNTNLSEAEAPKIIKENINRYFGINVDQLDGDVQTRMEYREDWNSPGSYVWSMSVYRYARDESLSIDMAISDKTFKVVQMYINDYKYNQQELVAKYTKAEAKAVADAFLKKVNSDLLDKIDLESENPYYYDVYYSNGIRPTEYIFFYNRLENGIPVAGNGINIGVNSRTGTVSNYSFSWSEAELPVKNDIISKEEAVVKFDQGLDVKLMYVAIQNRYYASSQKPTDIKLVYIPSYEAGNMVDAKTGEVIRGYGMPSISVKELDVSPAEKEDFKKLTDKAVRTKEMTKEDALRVGQNILEKLYGSKVEIVRSNYYSSQNYSEFNGRKVWQLGFRVGDNQHEGNISIDALTEEIMNLSHYDYYKNDMMKEGEAPKSLLTQEEAYDKAIGYLKEYYPGKLKSINTEISLNNIVSAETYFSFQRMENDILFQNNFISIGLDPETGLVTSMYYRWDDLQLSKTNAAISKEAAKEKYMAALDVKLQYQSIYLESNTAPDLKLVYQLLPKEPVTQYIDAMDGSLVDYYGKKVVSIRERQSNITELLKGHLDSKALTIMYDNGVLDLTSFKLEDSITKYEALKMMVLARGYHQSVGYDVGKLNFTDVSEDDAYYPYIQAAVANRMIENKAEAFNGDEIVTREKMAAMLIGMTYLDTAAEAKDIFKPQLEDISDIDPELLGYAALAYGLDIIKADENVFKPKESITLGEAAVAIYRTMELMGNLMN